MCGFITNTSVCAVLTPHTIRVGIRPHAQRKSRRADYNNRTLTNNAHVVLDTGSLGVRVGGGKPLPNPIVGGEGLEGPGHVELVGVGDDKGHVVDEAAEALVERTHVEEVPLNRADDLVLGLHEVDDAVSKVATSGHVEVELVVQTTHRHRSTNVHVNALAWS